MTQIKITAKLSVSQDNTLSQIPSSWHSLGGGEKICRENKTTVIESPSHDDEDKGQLQKSKIKKSIAAHPLEDVSRDSTAERYTHGRCSPPIEFFFIFSLLCFHLNP